MKEPNIQNCPYATLATTTKILSMPLPHDGSSPLLMAHECHHDGDTGDTGDDRLCVQTVATHGP